MHEIHLVLEWLAVAIDLTGAMIMVWAFVEAVLGLVRGSIRADRTQPNSQYAGRSVRARRETGVCP